MKMLLLKGVALVALVAGPAMAADMPVKATPNAVVGEYGDFFVWVDGSYQSIRLPTFDLGWRGTTGFPLFAQGAPLATFNPRANGIGISGGVGHVFSYGPTGPFGGSNTRVELDFLFVEAKADQSAFGSAPSFNTLQFVNGSITNAFGCGTGCPTTSTLASHYGAWKVEAKGATDFKFGAAKFSPFVAVFGGHARNNQDLFQQFVSAGVLAGNYSVNSAVNWTDVGARLGVDAGFNILPAVTLGLSGSVGLAHRKVSLTATDFCQAFNGFAGACNAPQTTSVTGSANTTPFLANAEASLTFQPTSSMAFKAFGGVNYDSRVPGISAPTFSGVAFAFGTTTPAGIKFEHEASWYTGGGILVKFGDPVVAKH